MSHPEMNIYIKLIPEIYLYEANNWNIKKRKKYNQLELK